MKPSKVIKSLMVLKDVTFQFIADELGKNSNATVSNAVYREERMKLETFMEILNTLDAEIVVRTKDGKFEWTISDENEPK